MLHTHLPAHAIANRRWRTKQDKHQKLLGFKPRPNGTPFFLETIWQQSIKHHSLANSKLIACAKFGLNPKAKIPQERQNSERALHVPLLLFISGRIKDRIQSCAGAHSAVHIHCTCVSPYTNEPQAPLLADIPKHMASRCSDTSEHGTLMPPHNKCLDTSLDGRSIFILTRSLSQ